MKSILLPQFLDFLQNELAIPSDAIATAMRQNDARSGISQLPMLLWQYGLVSLKQLDLIFDWLETV
ncbi:MAG: DUF2949 domain-containing protein [Cyanobacteriota bacterium]|nr:DUF2949 domain-containing protein [Cyanobacteriota bacterium]